MYTKLNLIRVLMIAAMVYILLGSNWDEFLQGNSGWSILGGFGIGYGWSNLWNGRFWSNTK